MPCIRDDEWLFDGRCVSFDSRRFFWALYANLAAAGERFRLMKTLRFFDDDRILCASLNTACTACLEPRRTRRRRDALGNCLYIRIQAFSAKDGLTVIFSSYKCKNSVQSSCVTDSDRPEMILSRVAWLCHSEASR